MVLPYGVSMIRGLKGKKITSLRQLLLWWIIGSGIVLVLLYSLLADFFFRFGVNLLTKADLGNHAAIYAKNYVQDRDAPLPSGQGLTSYLNIENLPDEIKRLFPESAFQHKGLAAFADEDDVDFELPDDYFESLCGLNCELIFLYSYQLNETNWLYMTQSVIASEEVMHQSDISDGIVFLMALVILVLFAVLASFLIHKIGRPVNQLASWAANLSLHQIEESIPDFTYQELNMIAHRLEGAFQRIAQSVEKESRFLQHASHELRTPIAIASGNIELLERFAELRETSESEQQTLKRLNFAVRDMQQLTEMLLWLNRDNESQPENHPNDIGSLASEMIDDNRYLLESKPVKVELIRATSTIDVPITLCQIVLANLIRNAFQYTQEGTVRITVTDNSVVVDNENVSSAQEPPEMNSDYGFGLGLEIVERICERLNWRYEFEARDNGRYSAIYFL